MFAAGGGCLRGNKHRTGLHRHRVLTKIGGSKDSYTFAGRTMEFGPDVTSWKLMYVPHNYQYNACDISGLNTCGEDPRGVKIKGYSWPVTYAYVGFAPMRPIKNPLNPGKPFEYTMKEVTDGINEAGLYCGGFYHMHTETYSDAPYANDQRNISAMDFVPGCWEGSAPWPS